MKIRTDFVTNSSSTVFLLIRRGVLTLEGVRELMGVRPDSPMVPVADALYYHLKSEAHSLTEDAEASVTPTGPVDYVSAEFSVDVAARVREAVAAGAAVEIGTFSSERDGTEVLFCCDSFEMENQYYYLNALRCYW